IPFTVTVPQPKRWSPWRVGDATLHQAVATVTVSGRESVKVSELFGFRDVQLRPRPEGWEVKVNGAPFFIRGASYQPELRLDRLGRERFEADLALARETNLDALRVHGHVLPEEFYRLADRAGMLVFADLPLTGSGDLDSQVRAGWTDGPWPAIADREPRFVSEYGAQAFPALDSPVWEDLSRAWPIADDDPGWLYAGFDPFAWIESGVGLPSD